MKIASQAFASRFGTYREGDEIDEAAAASVLEAWEAAGLIEDGPAPVAAAEPEKPSKPAKAPAPPKPEKATRPAPEKRARLQVKATAGPHRRFVADAKGAEA